MLLPWKILTMLNSIVKNAGLITALIGAILTAFQITPINIYIANLGALFYAIWAWRVRDFNIFLVNVGLLVIYLSGTMYHHREFILSYIK